MDIKSTITNAKYLKDKDGSVKTMKCDYNGQEISVPLNLQNRHYAEIMKQVKEGTLTIEDAD